MKKLLVLALSTLLILSLTACGSNGNGTSQDETVPEETQPVTEDGGQDETEPVETEPEVNEPDSVTITTLNADKEKIQIEVPYNPERIAVMDLAVLDMVDNYGYGDRVVGVSKGSSIDYLQKYVDDDSILNLGTIKEASLEAVMECEPDIIFIGGRLSSIYDELTEIAPVVYLATDVEIGLVNSINENALTVASIFGAEEKAAELLSSFDDRIETLAAFAEGKTAFVGMLNAGGFNVLGNDGRCSLIGVEVGFENIGLGAESSGRSGGGERSEGGENSETSGTTTSTHGNETSFEYIVRLDPDYIFVMNRDDAIGTEGAETAQEVIENELVMKTAAYENGNIVYLQYSNVWYTAEGGITALDYMLTDLETALLD